MKSKSKSSAGDVAANTPTARVYMEDAVREVAALNTLLLAFITAPESPNFVMGDRDSFNCGLMLLTEQTNKRLVAAWQGDVERTEAPRLAG